MYPSMDVEEMAPEPRRAIAKEDGDDDEDRLERGHHSDSSSLIHG